MQETNENLFGLEFDHQASAYIVETAKWSRFLAIIGFICCGLILLGAIGVGTVSNYAGSGLASDFYAAGMGGFVVILYICLAALCFFPNLFRYQFATKALRAIRDNDQPLLVESLAKLKSLHKFLGILTIIMVSFFVLSILLQVMYAIGR